MIRALSLTVAAAALALATLAPRPAAAQQIVTCSSTNHDRTFCNVNARAGVQLYRQLSDSPCVRNRSWGVSGNRLWVSRGCRAQFRVGAGARDGRYDDRARRRDDDRYGRNDRRANLAPNQAAALCRNQIRRVQGVQNRDVRLSGGRRLRDGDYHMEWRARGRSGTCTVDARTRRVNLRYDRGNRR